MPDRFANPIAKQSIPFSDYLRVTAMGLVVLLTMIALKLESLLSNKTRHQRVIDRLRPWSLRVLAKIGNPARR